MAAETTELETWELLKDCSNMTKEIHIQWTPGHAKLRGNDSADRTARLATRLDQTLQPLDTGSYQTKHYTKLEKINQPRKYPTSREHTVKPERN